VPECNATLPFASFEQMMSTTETNNSIAACSSLMSLCDYNVTWNVSQQNIFNCGNLNDPTSQCLTFGEVLNMLDTVTVKQGVPANASCGVSIPNADCNIQECATSCVDAQLKNSSATTVEFLGFANKTFTAYTEFILPLMDCNVLLNITLQPFTTCHKFSNSLELIGAGAIVYGAFFFLGIWVLLLGQKRFFSRTKVVYIEHSKLPQFDLKK